MTKTCEQCHRQPFTLDQTDRYTWPARCWVHLEPTLASKARSQLVTATAVHRTFTPEAEGFDCKGQVLQNVTFQEGNFQSANFRNCLLVNVRFVGTNLTAADFRGHISKTSNLRCDT